MIHPSGFENVILVLAFDVLSNVNIRLLSWLQQFWFLLQNIRTSFFFRFDLSSRKGHECDDNLPSRSSDWNYFSFRFSAMFRCSGINSSLTSLWWCPTVFFTILEPLNPSCNVPELNNIYQSPDLEGRSGYQSSLFLPLPQSKFSIPIF